MHDEYFACLEKYEEKYGPRTIVLYMVGSFYEMYGIDNDREKIGHLHEICEFLNIQVTRKNKEILENSRKNPLMAGVPSLAVDRYVSILLDHNYTVVIVDQVTPPPKPKREVTHIYSPGTNITKTTPDTNFILSIYIEQEAPGLYSIGLSVCDITTGESICYETHSRKEDDKYSLDETYRFIQTYNPSEILVTSRNLDLTEAELTTYWELSSTTVHWTLNKIPKEYYHLAYQHQFFGKIYPRTGLLSPIEYMDLEKMPGAILAFLTLLQFIYEHNEKFIECIKKPTIWQDRAHLILANNAISQLNLSGGGARKTGSVLNIINHTKTAMGHRLLKDRLLSPIVDLAELERRYGMIECLLASRDTLDQLIKFLTEITDVEKLHRKMALKMLRPCDFNDLDLSYQNITRASELIKGVEKLQDLLPGTETGEKFKTFCNKYEKVLNLEETGKYGLNNVSANFFRVGYNTELDALHTGITQAKLFFELLARELGNFIDPKSTKELVKVCKTDQTGYYLQLTAVRYKTLAKNFTANNELVVGDKKYTIKLEDFRVDKNRSGNTVNLSSELIREISDQLVADTSELSRATLATFVDFQAELTEEFQSVLRDYTAFIAKLDVYVSSAYIAIKYNYCRPTLLHSEHSQIHAVDLRHAIIERLDTSLEYVPHPITLDDQQLGMLVYGVNCSGKSSCMKSIGIAVCLAQAGFYVPATEFKFTPYNYILTRIIGNDNLFKGLSSFAVEMSELRGILKRAGPRSLILGDEICHGTETISAISIVASAVLTLDQQNANFVFATHLHQLSQMERISDLSRVKHFHLKVSTDARGALVYDRQLVPGAGENLYGIEVAKAMGLDGEFIKLSHQIRKELLNMDTNLLNTQQSRYNARLFLDVCQVCHRKSSDTHHIKPQELANNDNFIGTTRKNARANLVPLCKTCHQKIHQPPKGQPRLIIHGYVLTCDGIQLDWENVS